MSTSWDVPLAIIHPWRGIGISFIGVSVDDIVTEVAGFELPPLELDREEDDEGQAGAQHPQQRQQQRGINIEKKNYLRFFDYFYHIPYLFPFC